MFSNTCRYNIVYENYTKFQYSQFDKIILKAKLSKLFNWLYTFILFICLHNCRNDCIDTK